FAAESKKYPSHTLVMDATVRDLVRDGDKVRGVIAEHGSKRLEVRSKVVVGTDGRFSSLRRIGKFETVYDHHDFDVLWFTLPESPNDPSAFRAYLTPSRAYLALPK